MLKKIEKIKEISLDIMRHNKYVTGKLEIDIDCNKNRAVVRIHQRTKQTLNGVEFIITTTKLI